MKLLLIVSNLHLINLFFLTESLITTIYKFLFQWFYTDIN